MVWASRLLGTSVPERIATTDLAEPLAARLAAEGRRMFLLGGAPGVADAAADALRAKIPGLQVATSHGYRGVAAIPDMIDEIRAFGTDLLFVGLGDPHQLEFVARNRHELGPITVLTCGGLFDWLSGRNRRAPAWMISSGLEWFWRLLIEPRRLFRRYVVGNPEFVARVAIQWFRARRSEPAPAARRTPRQEPVRALMPVGETMVDSVGSFAAERPTMTPDAPAFLRRKTPM